MTVAALTEPDIYEAVYDFVHTFCPNIPEDAIYRGWESRSALPSLSEEYAVISILGHYRRGTTVEYLEVPDEEEDGQEVLEEHLECDVQIDVCSSTDNSRRYAQILETIGRSSRGVRFFRDYDIGCLYATDVQDLSFTNDSDVWTRRSMLTLRLSYKTGVSVTQQWFGTLDVGIKNVDVFYPPSE